MKKIIVGIMALGSISAFAGNPSCELTLSRVKDPVQGGSVKIASKRIQTVFADLDDLTIYSESIQGYQADVFVPKAGNVFKIQIYNQKVDGTTQLQAQKPIANLISISHSDASAYTATVNCTKI